ncbi:MAG: sulfite exporter TauE/SafE family protein [Candidatus Latescibacteria bacterium]|nr:sulfite exporter TauE/SafE family protein [Candidatus Latescibacterota bacterium]
MSEPVVSASELYYPTAFVLGALHSFEPGHGKAVMAAYLVGPRRRVVDAILLSLVITITHTFSVVLLGVAAWVGATHYHVEITGPVLSLIGGLLVLGVGLWMLVRWRTGACPHPGHGHHVHESGGADERESAAARANASIGQLIVVGIAGGLVPCPAGVALLMTAVADGRLAQGFELAAVFSLGVGVVVMAVGLIVCKAAAFTTRWLSEVSPFTSRLPLISGVLVTALGLWLSGSAVADLSSGGLFSDY